MVVIWNFTYSSKICTVGGISILSIHAPCASRSPFVRSTISSAWYIHYTLWKLTGWKNLDLQRKLGKIAWPMQLILIISLEQSQTFAKMSHVENLIPNLKSSHRVSDALEMHTCRILNPKADLKKYATCNHWLRDDERRSCYDNCCRATIS